jgi:hypothetical protein
MRQTELSKTVRHKFQNNVVVEEQRNFSNPHVRFRRINGRIVPIVNNKRLGQDIASSGYSTAKLGAGFLGFGKRYLAKKLPKIKMPKGFTVKSFKYSPVTKKGKSLKFAVKTVAKTTKFAIKNPFKLGLGLLGLGVSGVLAGNELQMRSVFGKDFFFIKDEHGKEN